MKFATWNVRGFGTDKKNAWLKRLVNDEKLNLMGLTKVNHQEVTQRK